MERKTRKEEEEYQLPRGIGIIVGEKSKSDYGILLLYSSLGYFLRTSIDRDIVGVASPMILYSQKHEHRKQTNLEVDLSAKKLAIFLEEIVMSSMLLRRYYNLEVGMSMGKEGST